MAFDDDLQSTLAEYRILLIVLRTAKFRTQLGRLLTGEDVRNTVEGPLGQLDWLGREGDDNCGNENADEADKRVVNADVLASRLESLATLMGETAILHCGRIAQLPTSPEGKHRVVKAVIDRVFEAGTGPRGWLTEPQVNDRLSMVVEDVSAVRRLAVDFGILNRADDGSRYWLAAS